MKRSRMALGVVLAALTLVGCGGGGSQTKLVPNSKAVTPAVKAHVVATTRVARSMFIVAGLGRHLTRAVKPGGSTRFQRILAALKHHRDATAELNTDLNLYQNFIVNEDGSGHQDLFTDAARQTSAGSFTWSAPQWYNGQPDSYPALINTVYNITGGNLAGNQGTMTALIQDPAFNNGTIHLTFKDAQGELGIADFTIVNGMVSSKDTITLADLVVIKAEEHEDDNYTDDCYFYFPDDSQVIVNINPDGPDQETYTDPSGNTISTGTIQDDGTGTFQYDDGSSDTVNVDTSGNSSDNSGDNSGDNSKKVKKRSVIRTIRR